MSKNKHIFVFTIIFLFSIYTLTAQIYQANVSVVKQEQTNWCWAADSKCVLDYYGFPQTQCTINNFAWSKTTCCSSPSGCNQTNQVSGTNGAIDKILLHFGNLNSVRTYGAYTTSKVSTVLGAKRPFIIGIFWSGGGGHVVVGCAFNSSTNKLTIMDSWQNNGMTTVNYTGSTSITTGSGSGNIQECLEITTPYTVGINEIAKTKVNAYPNPTNDNFNIEFDNTSNNVNRITIENLVGQEIYSEKVSDFIYKKSFDLNNFPKGVYIIKPSGTETILYSKLIKQ